MFEGGEGFGMFGKCVVWGVKGLGGWGVWRGFKGVGVGYLGVRGWVWFNQTL